MGLISEAVEMCSVNITLLDFLWLYIYIEENSVDG